MTATAQEAAKYGITFSTGAAATPQGVANAAANGIINNVQTTPNSSGQNIAVPGSTSMGQNVSGQTITPNTPATPAPVQPAPTPITPANIKTAFENTVASGQPAPQTQGEAASAITQAVNTAQTSPTFYKPDPNSPQVVDAQGNKLSYDQYIAAGGKSDFSNTKVGAPPNSSTASPLSGIEDSLSQDKGYQQLLADRKDYMDTVNQSGTLLDFYNKAIKDAGIPAINAELINSKKIIDGTEDDIRNEVKAASGFATDSQVLALSSARNKTLIKNYNALLDTKAMAMESVNTMVNLAGQDRAFALQSITQKLQIDQQINDYRDKFVNNAKEGYNNYIKAVGYTGMYQALAHDPQSLAMAEKTMGLPAGTIQQAAAQEAHAQTQKDQAFAMDQKVKQANINQSNASAGASAASAAKTRLETSQLLSGSTNDKVQQKLEQEYRNILAKEVSSRSGTVGTEDAKIAQANHLASLMNQYYDSKTGNYNVPKSQYGELVLGLAGMLSKTGTPTDNQVNSITQATIKGDLAKAIGYITGSTPTGSSQAVLKNLADSIDRQAKTAEQNREAGLKVLRGLAPTDLDPARAAQLEANTLVPFSGINGIGQPKPSGYLISLPGGKSLDLGNFETK